MKLDLCSATERYRPGTPPPNHIEPILGETFLEVLELERSIFQMFGADFDPIPLWALCRPYATKGWLVCFDPRCALRAIANHDLNVGPNAINIP